MVQVHNFSYGPLNPGFAYLTSCLGCFLGLQCTARARAMQGADRARWLLLAAVSIGAAGIWVMHFIAMLGFTISGQVITYNVPVTIPSMHYVGMWALRMPDTMGYNARLVALSVAIAIVAGTVALWAALRLGGVR